MPYFVYRVQTDPASDRRTLTHLDTVADYQAARRMVREQRAAADVRPEEFRMIFAPTEAEAERMLAAPREAKVIGED